MNRYELEFAEDFAGGEVDAARWIAHYLPHWTTPDRSAARYEIRDGVLRLRIDADQPAWRPEDGEMRVSNLQTATFPGQHRHRPGLAVRTPVPARRLYAPTYGRFEAEMRAPADRSCMLAFWLVGVEEEGPEDCGEICVAELFGEAMGARESRVRIGVKAHHDPRLRDDMEEVSLPLDARDWHAYAAEWEPDGVRFFVDGRLVRAVEQRIAYPLQLMVDLFEFPESPHRHPAAYPKIGEVRAVRGSRLAG